MKYILLILVSAFCAFNASAETTDGFGPYSTEDVARRLCQDVFNSKDFIVEAYFDESFQGPISSQQLKESIGLALEAAGYCLTSTVQQKNGDVARVVFQTAFGNAITVDLVHNERGLVKSMNIAGVSLPSVKLQNWSDVSRWLAVWPGFASLTVARLDSNPLELGAKDIAQPIEASFKLFVLRALEEEIYAGRRKWSDSFPIRNDWKSLPGPIEWPQGKSITLEQFAHAMIMYDDNTAADHIVRILGRDVIERGMLIVQHQHPEWNKPFLRTDEAFKLKWGASVELTQKYLRATPEEKRVMLDREIATMSISSVGKNGLPMTAPTWIRQIEWFATPSDMCRTMRSFLTRKDPVVLKAMALQSPLVGGNGDASYWTYVGYKGGTEPGVLSSSYLLLDRYGRWSCLSAAWSNDKRVVNPWLFYDVVQKSLNML